MTTTPFENRTDAGNELAIRRGKQVPDDAVALSYVRSSMLNPKDNLVIVDTSRIVEQNILNLSQRRQLMYANSLGVLEDVNGNQLVDDEFPFITDVFTIDEDFSALPASEYVPENILPFLHVSRHFHLDFAGLTLPGDLFEFREDILKVVDAQGRTYLDVNGAPKYKVRIAPAIAPASPDSSQSAYRVYVYVDTDENNELYLVYNKVELNLNGSFKRQRINYKELLNLRPVFEYLPEESEVVDWASLRKKVYSTKPITLKEQILGLPYPNVDGYKVYVPKKAIGDPRIFQLFHWRVSCDFTSAFNVDITKLPQAIRCGVVVTNGNPQSAAPYSLYNLLRSQYRTSNVGFENPLAPQTNVSVQKQASYWYVNFDTVSLDDLKKFDFLVWAPTAPGFDFGPYTQKIDTFTRSNGGTLFIDTSGVTIPSGLGVSTTNGVTPSNGAVVNPGTAGSTQTTSVAVDSTDPLFNGNELGGWKIPDLVGDDESLSLSWIQQLFSPGYTQYITAMPADWSTLVTVGGQPVTVRKKTGTGNIIFSTFSHLYSCSALFSHISADIIAPNRDAESYVTALYSDYVNSIHVEGAMKFLYNAMFLAVSERALDTADSRAYSSKWTYYTPWKTSWVIDARNDILSQAEKDRYSFALLPTDPAAATPDLSLVWKRRLSEKTNEQLINEAILIDPLLQQRQLGGVRQYRIQATNPAVAVESVAPDTGHPTAWTLAYSPKFVVPTELGPNVIREEEVAGNYSTGQYEYRTYPSKPYGGHIQASYTETSEHLETVVVNWTLRGTALETFPVTISTPGSITSSTSEIELSWWLNPKGAGYPEHNTYHITTGLRPRYGYDHPDGIATWQEANYYGGASGNAHLNWPFIGMTGRFLQGSRGEVVQFIQEALNKFRAHNFFSTSAGQLPVDGVFGPRVADAVSDLQTALGARFVDGIIDAETWSIIGYQIIRGDVEGQPGEFRSQGRTDYHRFFDYPFNFLPVDHISDSGSTTVYAKRSWSVGGASIGAPSSIWDFFSITFDRAYDIHAITVIPYLEGQTQTLIVRSMDVTNEQSLTGYTGENARVKGLWRPANGEKFTLGFGATTGNTIIVGLGQDGPAGPGWGEARMFGVRDIVANATVNTTQVVPGTTITTQEADSVQMVATGTVTVSSLVDGRATPNPQPVVAPRSPESSFSPPTWNPPVQVDVTDVKATLLPDGSLIFQRNVVARDSSFNNFSFGPDMPGGTYYSMSINKELNPIPEVGQVSKVEGIKLLCKLDKTPYGFPVMPTSVGAFETQRHFLTLSLIHRGKHPLVTMGFYDVTKRQFIVNANGAPEMSYIDWVQRGPQNVYIGVMTAFEDTGTSVYPADDESPKLPHRWAMPAYGLMRRSGAKITLEPLPPNLGLTDVWPIAVRNGSFSRSVAIRARVEGSLGTYLANYQGINVRAFYGIPDGGGWSTLYGPPFADVLGESPIITDSSTIQVRQTPILINTEPALSSSYADPVRPAFVVSTRISVNDPWVPLSWASIRDYNRKTGEIFLTVTLRSDDPALVKVDYTTERRNYYFKRYGSTLLNLNPYSGTKDLIGKPIYVYIVPQYVKDVNGSIIPESVTHTPLRFTNDPDLFDPMRPSYDQLAVLLGVIYISTALDIQDLAMLDVRRRGGGVPDSANAQEVARIIQDSASYWDINLATGASYQKAGYIVVRLPAALREEFSEQEIVDVVKANITAGVGFKLEDLAGNEWSPA